MGTARLTVASMVPCILWRWSKMEVPSATEILVPSMARAIVMHSAHMTSSGSIMRPIWRIGSQVKLMRMQALAGMEHVAQRLICGKPTTVAPLSPYIPVPLPMMDNTDAEALTVVTMVKTDSKVCVTRTGVTSSHTV